MLTGTETRPNEMVAVPIERAGIWLVEEVVGSQPAIAAVTNISALITFSTVCLCKSLKDARANHVAVPERPNRR